MHEIISGEACARMTRELSFFRFLSDQELADLSHHFTCRHVPAGTVLWKEGDACEDMAFITAGRMLIKVGTEFAGKDVVVGVLTEGAMVGERGMLDGSPHKMTAEALEDLDLVVIDHDNFQEILETHEDLALKLLQGMLLSTSTRFENALNRLASVF